MYISLNPRVAKERLFAGLGDDGLSLDKQPRVSICVCVGLLVVWEGAGGGKRREVNHLLESRGWGPGTDGHF